MLDILIAEDEATFLTHMARRLSRAGHRVRTAGDGVEALKLTGERVPDVAIIDIIMPECDGLEVIIQIRNNFPCVKLLAISGGGRWGHLHYLGAARKLGAHDILAKPFSTQTLIDAITRLGPVALQQQPTSHCRSRCRCRPPDLIS